MSRLLQNSFLRKIPLGARTILLVTDDDHAAPAIARWAGRPLRLVTLPAARGREPGARNGALAACRGPGCVVRVFRVVGRTAVGMDAASRSIRFLVERGSRWGSIAARLAGAEAELVCGVPHAVEGNDDHAWSSAIDVALDELPPTAPGSVIPDFAVLDDEIRREVEAAGHSWDRARPMLRKMANAYHVSMLSAWRGAIETLCKRFFRGVVIRDASALDALPPDARIVYLPLHRSHLDYMLLPYVLLELGQAAPLSAAGDNLDFLPAGTLMRSSLAFFIRRDASGGAAYRAVFSSYVGALLRHGVPLGFFAEGGRSRDGRARVPKLGLLKMVEDHAARAGAAPVYLVPVWISYERCPEGASLARQALGQAKPRDSARGVTRALPVLLANHGRAFIGFGPAWHVPAAAAPPAEALMRRLLATIQSRAVVAPSQLLAASLAAHGHQASLAELCADARRLGRYLYTLARRPRWPVRLVSHSTARLQLRRGVAFLDDTPVELDQDDEGWLGDLALLDAELTGCEVHITGELARARIAWSAGQLEHLIRPLTVVAGRLAGSPAADRAALAAEIEGERHAPDRPPFWPDETAAVVLLDAVEGFLVAEGLLATAAGADPVRPAAGATAHLARWATLHPSHAW